MKIDKYQGEFMDKQNLTPMMQQYMKTKEEYKDCILFYRLGDFYEMFFDDAKIASKELELTLTGKNCGLEERAPMCGVPFHAVEGYLSKLVSRGYKVAICEQVEDPALAKGLVKREVIRVVTPGTNLNAQALDESKNNYIMSIVYVSDRFGISFADAVGPAAFVTYIRAILLRDTGATISPFNAFLLLQGTETLSLRIERHVENTKKVVEFLTNHPQVEHVNHPSLPNHPDHALYEKYFPNGGASIFTFDIKGGKEAAFKFIDKLQIFSLLANVADVKSLVIHPATTTHSQLTAEELEDQGIHQGTIRLSIGTENINDILADLEQAFN